MKYLCLAYYDEKKFDTLSKSEVDAIVSRCGPYDDALRDSGHLLASGSLQPARSSIAVRPRNGKVAITDGPFTESKELVGGFAILQANSKEEAIQLARDFLRVVGQGECELRQLYEAPAAQKQSA